MALSLDRLAEIGRVLEYPKIRRNLPCRERDAAIPGEPCVTREKAKNLPACVRQLLLNLADERGNRSSACYTRLAYIRNLRIITP